MNERKTKGAMKIYNSAGAEYYTKLQLILDRLGHSDGDYVSRIIAMDLAEEAGSAQQPKKVGDLLGGGK